MPGVIPVAVTTETIVRVVRESLGTDLVVWLPPRARRVGYASRCVLVGLVVDRIVDARGWCSCPPLHSLTVPLARLSMVVVVGVVVCVGLLVPVSSEPLPVFHFRPINPVVCWGPTKEPEPLVETLS